VEVFFGMQGIKWNFTRFLVDRKGRVVGRFSPRTEPKSLAIPLEGLLDSRN
jgi:glutathione peroxidase